jgi:hypothetical protein
MYYKIKTKHAEHTKAIKTHTLLFSLIIAMPYELSPCGFFFITYQQQGCPVDMMPLHRFIRDSQPNLRTGSNYGYVHA